MNRTILVLHESSPLTYVTLIGGILFNRQYTLQITIQNNEWENVTLMRNFTFVGMFQRTDRQKSYINEGVIISTNESYYI